jgi:hypothetical protein
MPRLPRRPRSVVGAPEIIGTRLPKVLINARSCGAPVHCAAWRIDLAAGLLGLLHGRKTGAVADLASDLDELWLLHASPDGPEADAGFVRGSGSGRSIILDARVGPPAWISYLSARASRRFRVNGSARLARSRTRWTCCLSNSLFMAIPKTLKETSNIARALTFATPTQRNG